VSIDAPTLLLTSGALYSALPVTVWVLLRSRHPALRVDLWCGSGLLFSLALLLFGLRGQIDDWYSVHLANAAGFASILLKTAVLRLEAQRPGWARPLAVAWLLGVGVVLATDLGLPPLRPGLANLLNAGYGALAALVCWQLARQRPSRSAQLMALFLALAALAVAVRGVLYLAHPAARAVFAPDLSFVATVSASLLAAVVVNIGYMGLALDRLRQLATDQQQAMDTLRENQRAQDLAARTREAVAGERARTTRLLAHEVRQPLHNAAVALQSGVATLARSRDASEVSRAIEQAQAVIRRVSATLDNTVAATTLLAAQGRISTADTDLQMLIDLSLGDLPPEARARVQVDYRADARSARLEASLVRLALRNLLMNASLYAPADSPVLLRVLDSDEPLALVLEVLDQGPGIADELRELIFEEGVRGPQSTVPGYGLGLHVVKRVARLHGGSIAWRANQPQGSIFSLTLPQGDPG
jgi:signal transduction histidine kinase